MPRQQPICIDLDLPSQPGFRKFISSWLYRNNGLTFLVDPGPLATLPHLLTELRRLGVKQLDYIFLTHIHIDHAGGCGALLAAFPDAQVICHPEARGPKRSGGSPKGSPISLHRRNYGRGR